MLCQQVFVIIGDDSLLSSLYLSFTWLILPDEYKKMIANHAKSLLHSRLFNEGRNMSEGRQITRSASKVGFFTLASRILGLIRDSLVAAFFPRTATDAFYVAYTIPNVLRQLLAEGAFTVSFIPVFTEYRANRSIPEIRAMLSNMLGSILLVLSLVVLLGILTAPWLVRLFAFGFTDNLDKLHLAIVLTRIMFIFILLVGLTAMAMGVLNTFRHFTAPALAPIFLNVGIITVVYLGTPFIERLGFPSIYSYAFGVILGGAMQILLQLPFLYRRNMFVAPRLGFTDPAVLRVGKLMLPAVFGLAVAQVNIILSRQFASFLEEGSISYIYYAQRLIEFPLGIFAVAFATVSLPNLSSYAHARDMEGLKATYRHTLSLVLLIMLPASTGLGALALPITAILFKRGNFSYEMAIKTAYTLKGFLIGLWAGAGVRQTVPVFYALQDTKTPVKVACLAVLVYALSAWCLYQRLGTVGLALAMSFSSITNFITLLLLLRRRLGRLGLRTMSISLTKCLVAALAAGIVAWQISRLISWEGAQLHIVHFGLFSIAAIAAILVYIGGCYLLRTPELNELMRAFFSHKK